MAKDQSWIADLLAGYRTIQVLGSPLPQRPTLNLGAGILAVDNPTNNSTDLAAPGGNWLTVLDLDFTAQPNQTFATDTNYTIAGQTWSKLNSSGDSVAPAIVNGTGLVWQPNSFGSWLGTDNSLSALRLPLSSFLSQFDWSTKFRLYLSVGADNASADGDALVWGIDSGSTDAGIAAFRGYGVAGAPMLQVMWRVHASQPGGTGLLDQPFTFTGTGTKTVVVEFDGLGPFAQGARFYYGAGGSPGSAFPLASTLSAGYSVVNTTVASGGIGLHSVTSLPSNMNLFIGAQKQGAAYTTTVQRIRVDAK